MALLVNIILSFRLCTCLLTSMSWSKSGQVPGACPGDVCCDKDDILQCFICKRGPIYIGRTIKQKRHWIVYKMYFVKKSLESVVDATPFQNVSITEWKSPTTPVQQVSMGKTLYSQMAQDAGTTTVNPNGMVSTKYTTNSDKTEFHASTIKTSKLSDTNRATRLKHERNKMTTHSTSTAFTEEVLKKTIYKAEVKLTNHKIPGSHLTPKEERGPVNSFKITMVYAIYLHRNKPVLARIDREKSVFKTIRSTPRINAHRFLVTRFITDPSSMTVYQASDRGIFRFRLGSYRMETLISHKTRVLCLCFDHIMKTLFYVETSKINSYFLISFDVKTKERRETYEFTKVLQYRGFDPLTQQLFIGYKGGKNLTFMSYVYPKTGPTENFIAQNLFDEVADCTYNPEREVMVYCSSLKKQILSFHVKTGVISSLFKSPYEDGSCAKLYLGGDFIHALTDRRLEEYNFEGEKVHSTKLPKRAVGIRLIYF